MEFVAILVSLVLVLIIGYFVIHAATKIAKIALILLLIFLISSTFFGVNLLTDISELKDQFPKARKLILLNDNGIRAGFETAIIDSETVVSFVSEPSLNELQQQFTEGNLDAMKGSYFKVIIIEASAFDNGNAITLFDGISLTASQAVADIRADNTLDRAITKLITAKELPNTPEVRTYVADNLKQSNISTSSDMRAVLFAQLFSSEIQDDPLFFINKLREDKLLMYPESITFKFAQYIPQSIIQRVLGGEAS